MIVWKRLLVSYLSPLSWIEKLPPSGPCWVTVAEATVDFVMVTSLASIQEKEAEFMFSWLNRNESEGMNFSPAWVRESSACWKL